MIRRFNYTGRVKIPRNKVDISMSKDKEGKYFHAKVDLSEFKFLPEAKIYIEAYYKDVHQRFAFGTVANFKEPDSTRLNELPETELAYFDVSVVDESGKVGLLLGVAKGIAVSTDGIPNDRIPLLPVNPTDLKNQIWKLSFEAGNDNSPILEINRNIPDVLEMARNKIEFISLVYPAAFRGVLYKIIKDGDSDPGEDSWVSNWFKFINNVLGIKRIPDMENMDGNITTDQEEWIDECVNEYCNKYKLFEKFTAL